MTLPPDLIQVYPFPFNLIPPINRDLDDVELLLHRLDEPPIRLPPLLEAEIADCLRTQQLLHGFEEEGKCRFEVDAVGGEDHVWIGLFFCHRWSGCGEMVICGMREWGPPVQDGGLDLVLERVQGDVLLHQAQHGQLVGDEDGFGGVTGSSDG